MLDLLEAGKLKKRVDTKTEDKLAQKVRLKSMLLADQIPLRRLVFLLIISELTQPDCCIFSNGLMVELDCNNLL